ncbi:hypothetical protein MJO28_012653 [Puccinia striiformis f. sp. tritici]|uniref:Uncharacterized protein n=1 Tax=Puccinia striiformis f. sp. tritici TaxID=168172 RepID=A0ACC0E1R9_9BASI|nr:hypothetical protein MJO28_012653 [Puccinia striiformis f. sp. tritici]KAI7945391.1 hypothetical protein MJO29_011779 [Puccinia striiformis f. sp. tritici]
MARLASPADPEEELMSTKTKTKSQIVACGAPDPEYSSPELCAHNRRTLTTDGNRRFELIALRADD